jgi:hypothetical protein
VARNEKDSSNATSFHFSARSESACHDVIGFVVVVVDDFRIAIVGSVVRQGPLHNAEVIDVAIIEES